MLKRFTRYVTQSVAGMIGISVYVLADTFFISVYSLSLIHILKKKSVAAQEES